MSAIPAGRVFLTFATVAVGFASYMHFGLLGYRVGVASVGEVIGAALFLVAIPALVIVPWRIFQRCRGVITNAPILVGAIAFIVLMLLAFNGALTMRG